MPPIRRAAVTGLFALWLAPLPVLPGALAPGASTNGAAAWAAPAAIEDDLERRHRSPLEAGRADRGDRGRDRAEN